MKFVKRRDAVLFHKGEQTAAFGLLAAGPPDNLAAGFPLRLHRRTSLHRGESSITACRYITGTAPAFLWYTVSLLFRAGVLMKTSRDYRPLLAGLLIATIGLGFRLGWFAFGPGS